MKETLRILPMKALAALCLLLGLAPVWLLAGRWCLPEERHLWYLLPCLSALWGVAGYLFSGKGRTAFMLLGGALLTAYGAAALLPGGWMRILPLLPCWLILGLLPPAWARPLWAEWPLGAWAVGVFLHLAGQFFSGRPEGSGTAVPLSVAFGAYAFLLVLMLNRHGLREGMHGAQKAPAVLRRRNGALIAGLYVPALLAACWGTLGEWLDRVWNALKRGIARVVEWLSSLFPQEAASPQIQSESGGDAGLMLGAESAEPSFFAQMMEKLFLAVAFVLLAAAAVFLCVFFYKRLLCLWKRFRAWLRRYAAAAGEDYVDEAESTLNLEEKAQLLRGKLQRTLTSAGRSVPWHRLDGRARVRRLYQQFLRKTPAARSLTAREALTQDQERSAAQAAAFAELYERARYSEHDVSTQEADQLRQWIK